MAALIGLLGGTFDPVHNGHLGVAAHLCEGLDMDSVRFVLSAAPPHRPAPDCPVEHRLAMLRAALEMDGRLVPDTRELERTGPSYSVWTLRSLRRELPDSHLCWIVGADAWLGLRSWYHWQELSSLAHFVVVTRPGWELEEDREAARLSRDTGMLRRHTAGASVLYDGPAIDVSASDVRRRIAAGEDVSDAVPGPVWDYIAKQHLYHRQQSTE